MQKAAKIIAIIIACIIGIFVIFAFIYALNKFASAPKITSPEIIESKVISLTAVELYSAYENNEIAADILYEGKILNITGMVKSIGTDILGTPYIVLTDKDEWMLWGVQCMFSDEDKIILAQLSKGQVITIQGKCDGYLVNVLIKECSVIEP